MTWIATRTATSRFQAHEGADEVEYMITGALAARAHHLFECVSHKCADGPVIRICDPAQGWR